MMAREVVALHIALPSRSASSLRGRKPLASASLELEGGEERQIVLPVRVARSLEGERALPLPCEVGHAFELIHQLEAELCFETLVEMLSRREHSVAEARAGLLAYGYRSEEVEGALQKALASRFLDDERFTRAFIAERKRRGWGRRKIELELSRRGIDAGASRALAEEPFEEEDELSRAEELLARRPLPEGDAYARLVRRLMGKGFSYSVASQAARERIALSEAPEA